MREQIDFDGDVAVVTGGAGGIGGEIVEEFAAEGADVVIADVDADRGRAIAEAASDDHDGRAVFSEVDVSDVDACRGCVGAAVERFGGVDVLVNGATSRRFPREERFRPFVDQGPAHWDALVGVTLLGAVNMTHAALPRMIDAGSGAVVNISSVSRRGVSNLAAGDTGASTIYATVKEGLVGFTRAIATEVGGDGVRVNAVSPGTVRTQETAEMLERSEEDVAASIPLGRVGEPADVASAVLFLASDAAGWITGQTVPVNGGYL